MREINAQDITAVVKKLCMEANYFLPEDIQDKICKACDIQLSKEDWYQIFIAAGNILP